MKCKICKNDSNLLFSAVIIKKYKIDYFHCGHCGFLQTEDPYWLEEAYRDSINISDTGLLSRNINLSKITAVLIGLYFNKIGSFLDFGGGYGVFVRLMRDIGIDFFWQDKYTVNLFARGFEYKETGRYEIVTSFETFEHFTDPIEETGNMLKYSDSIIFTTNILPDKIPKPGEWWYYGLDHGQHISFYSRRTLEFIADKFKLHLYTNNRTVHMLTKKRSAITLSACR